MDFLSSHEAHCGLLGFTLNAHRAFQQEISESYIVLIGALYSSFGLAEAHRLSSFGFDAQKRSISTQSWKIDFFFCLH